MAKEDSRADSRHDTEGKDVTEKKLEDKIPFLKFVFLAVFALFVSFAILSIVPALIKVENPLVAVEGASLGSEKAEGQLIDITIKWEAPSVRNCYITTDVRPSGAQMGEPETAEWSNNHLIRYNLNTGNAMVENWINIEIIQQRAGTKTFHYLIAPASGNETKAFDVHAGLYCDDDFLAEDVLTVDRSQA